MKKRSLAALLALLMLLSSTACSETTKQEDPETTPPSNVDTTAPDSTTTTPEDTENLTDYELRQQIPDDLPDVTFNGDSFRITTTTGYDYEIVSDEMTGDPCNDAIFNRNVNIGERFNVKIECNTDDYPTTVIQTMATSGTDDADLVGLYNYWSYSPINAGACLNWTEVPHVNLEKPWHNSLANNNSTINNKLFTICSDLAITSMTYTYAFFFNIEMMEKYGYPSSDLYSMVKEGKWTIDQVISMTEEMYEDTNGNGKRDTDDVYGFGYQITNPADVWMTAFDQKICTVTPENTIELTFMSDKTVSLFEKLQEWHNNGTGFEKLSTQYDEEKYFLNNKLVMAPLRFYAAYNTLREMDSGYSMLPYPKWDEAQSAYYTNADDKFTAFALPITAYGNLDYIGTIYEALCAESYKKVYPEYYDTALKGKYSSEPETQEMVDLIMSGRNFDMAFQFGESHFQRLPYKIRDMLVNNQSDLASSYKKIEKALSKNIKNKLLKLYQD